MCHLLLPGLGVQPCPRVETTLAHGARAAHATEKLERPPVQGAERARAGLGPEGGARAGVRLGDRGWEWGLGAGAAPANTTSSTPLMATLRGGSARAATGSWHSGQAISRRLHQSRMQVLQKWPQSSVTES